MGKSSAPAPRTLGWQVRLQPPATSHPATLATAAWGRRGRGRGVPSRCARTFVALKERKKPHISGEQLLLFAHLLSCFFFFFKLKKKIFLSRLDRSDAKMEPVPSHLTHNRLPPPPPTYHLHLKDDNDSCRGCGRPFPLFRTPSRPPVLVPRPPTPTPSPSDEPPEPGCLPAPQPFALTFEKCQAEPGDGSCRVAPGQLFRFGWVSVCFPWRTPLLAGMKGEG